MSKQSINLNTKSRKRNTKKRERILGLMAVGTLIAAWVVGRQLASASIEPYLAQALPEATSFDDVGEGVYAAYATNSPEELIGYVTIGEATGYGGPLQLAVASDLEGTVTGIALVDTKETASFLQRVLSSDLLDSLYGKSYHDAFTLGEDVDGVTGATYTSRALAEAARAASQQIAREQLGIDVPRPEPPRISFGLPEIVLLGLFTAGFIGHRKDFKYKKQLRWATMLTGLVVLGFVFTAPFTLANFNQLLLGFWPQWQTHLYWYLLIGGIFVVFTVDNKNPYCEWFCPFGAAQECLGTLGKAKASRPKKYHRLLTWVQRGLAWLAILLALLSRNPGATSYEPFGTLFGLTGTTFQFVLLGIILVASLFIKRPWCNYLCPLRPVTDLYRTLRTWIVSLWKQKRPTKAA